MAERHSFQLRENGIVYTNHTFFIQSSVAGHLGGFCTAIANGGAVNVGVQVTPECVALESFGKYPGVA